MIMIQIKKMIINCPILFNFCRYVIDEYSTLKLRCFFKKYKKNPEEYINKLREKKKYRLILELKHNYRTFSAFYLNNVVSLILKCLMDGYIPIIQVQTGLDAKIDIWNDLFKQPFDVFDVENVNYGVETSKISIFKPSFSYIYNSKKRKLWGEIYSEFLFLNDTMKEYVENEFNNIISDKKVLGVICRGTDYTRTKPKYHPIQPNINDVLSEARDVMAKYNYEYIYLATEDKKYYDKFVSEFGAEKILTNNRKYYDELYDETGKNEFLYTVKFDRENDDYLKGREYLSSIILLSKCDSLIGGHCGGSDMAIYFNNCNYNYLHIFDCGTY
jgi:hypothetical protein